MDMNEDSAEESNAGGEQYEEEIVPKIITDEVFDEVTTRANIIIRDLQNSKSYLVAEDVQKLLLVCQNLKQNVIDEKDKAEQMKSEVAASSSRVQHAVKMSKQDQEVIQQLKSEIGTTRSGSFDNKLSEICTSSFHFLLLFPVVASMNLRSSLAQCGRILTPRANCPRSNECAA